MIFITKLFATIVTVSCLLGLVSSKLQCIGENGKPVDMFVLYKLPRITRYPTPELVHDGSAYAYLDSNDVNFSLSEFSITSEDSAAGKTLNQIYKNNDVKEVAHIFYNDAFNGTEFFDFGHSKGAVGFDDESGFWMIHSVPKYPPMSSDGYSYPSSGHKYGQIFLCVTFEAKYFDSIGVQLRYNHAHVHDGNLPEEFTEQFPNISKLLNGEMINDANNSLTMTSLNGLQFQSFAKSPKFNKDLYSEFVAPSLEVNLITETWQNGKTKNIGSTCDTDYTVEDATNLDLKFADGKHFDFETLDDHSKFAVGKQSNFVCIGDINRQVTQFQRGGGTLCLNNNTLHEVFINLITKINECEENIYSNFL